MAYISSRIFIHGDQPKEYQIESVHSGMIFLYTRIGNSEMYLGFNDKEDLMKLKTAIDNFLKSI